MKDKSIKKIELKDLKSVSAPMHQYHRNQKKVSADRLKITQLTTT
jgi:hypothetical protein